MMRVRLAVTVVLVSAALAGMAGHSHAYRLPGDPVDSASKTHVDALSLDFTDTASETELIHYDNDAASLEYRFEQPSGFGLTSRYSNRLDDHFARSGEANVDGYWDLELVTPSSGFLPGMEFNYSVGGFDGNTAEDFDDSQYQKIDFTAKGRLGFFDYGTRFNLTGSRYDAVDRKREKVRNQDRNRQVTKSWIGKSLGRFYVSQFIEQTRKNVDNSDRPEINESLVGSSVQVTLANWPYVGTQFAYASGVREGSRKSSGSEFTQDIASAKASLNASHNTWSADVSVSRMTPEISAGQYFGQPELTNFYIGGSWYPNSQLTITPYFNHGIESYQDWGVESEIESKAISATYRPRNKNYWLNVYVSEDSQENPDWGVDTRYFYSQASVEWSLGKRRSSRNLVSLSLGYSRYEDQLYSAANSDDVSVRITFKTYALDDLLQSRSRYRHNNYRFLNGLSATPFPDSTPANGFR